MSTWRSLISGQRLLTFSPSLSLSLTHSLTHTHTLSLSPPPTAQHTHITSSDTFTPDYQRINDLLNRCVRAKSRQSCLPLCDPMDCGPPGSSVHGILQARILEWVTMPCYRGSSWSGDWTHISCVSCIGRWVLYHYLHLGRIPHTFKTSPLVFLVAQLVKNPPAMRETKLDPWVGKIPWRRACNPLQYSCLENPPGQRTLGGRLWGCKESD